MLCFGLLRCVRCRKRRLRLARTRICNECKFELWRDLLAAPRG